MPLRSYRPTSPGRRQMTRSTFEEITTDAPHKPLTERLQKHAGRNRQGRITVRHQGSGHKRLYRVIDWKRDKPGVPARIATVEYDPNRSARIALLHYADGEKRYMLLPHGLGVGRRGDIRPGGRSAAGQRPDAVAHSAGHPDPQHRARRRPWGPDRALRGKQRAAARQGGQTTPPSGSPPARCAAFARRAWRPSARSATSTTGTRTSARPAAADTWAGAREVRGSAMNPRDHPHGGGEGKASTGMPPKTPWGKPAMGLRTRAKGNTSNKMIVRRRYGRG